MKMASSSNTLYVTFVDVDCNFLKIWGQKNRISASYIEKQLLQLIPELSKTPSLNPSLIYKGMLCYAKFSETSYYRARVISSVQNDSVGVFFVDYGYRNMIHISNIKIREGTEDVVLKMAEQADESFLARVIAPVNGWSSEIISSIRNLICNEELPYKEVALVEGQKFIEIQFQNEDLSNYLVAKKLAQAVPLKHQSQMVVMNSHEINNAAVFNNSHNHPIHSGFPNLSSQLRKISNKSSLPELNSTKDLHLKSSQFHSTHLVNLSQNTHPQYLSSGVSSSERSVNKSIAAEQYCSSLQNCSFVDQNLKTNKMSFESLLNNQCSLPQFAKNKSGLLFNKNVIEALAQQIKQYIAESNTKFNLNEENLPHNYISNVLKVGSNHNVFISCVDDGPWSFSVQLVSCEDELNKLMEDLTSAELIPVKPPIVLGHPCIAASIIYRTLCRGVIISISHSAANVYLVDFGDTESLPISSIYELPQRFFKTRVLSQKFCLTGLQNVPYSGEIKEYFKQIVQDKLLILKVASLEGDNLPSCEMYVKSKNIKRMLNEKIQMARTMANDTMLDVGAEENVVVTWVDSVQRFYVQLRKRDAELNGLKNELALSETEGEEMTFDELKVGLQCICKFMEDGQWYRAKITSLASDKHITVFYIDYGNTETVDISLLRKIKNYGLIAHMKNQAILCCLQEFESKPYDQELSYELEKLTLEKNVKMIVTSANKDLLYVKLFTDDKDIVPIIINSLEKKSKPVKQEINLPKKNIGSENTSPYLSHRENVGDKNRLPSGHKSSGVEKENWRAQMQKLKVETNEFKPEKKSRFDDVNCRSSSNLFSRNRDLREKNKNFDKEEFRSNEKPFSSRGQKKSYQENIELNDHKKKPHVVKNEKGKASEIDLNELNDFSKINGKRNKSRALLNKSNRQNFASIKRFSNDSSDENKNLNKLLNEKKMKYPIPKGDLPSLSTVFKKKIIEIGSSDKAVITYYINPYEFYIQILNEEEEFKDMMQNIQIYYSDKLSIKHQLAAGNIVIAQFSYDDILYRGEVVTNDPLVVRYVDYGNQEEIGQMKLWMVAKQFINLPKQSIRCKLANIKPIGEQWPSLGSPLDSFFESEEYKCTFLDFVNDTYEVELEALGSGKNLATEIIAGGFGVLHQQSLFFQDMDFSLLPKQILRVKASAVESFQKFFVVFNQESVEILERRLMFFIENKKLLKPIEKSSLEVNMLCLVMHNKCLSRGKILNFNENTILIQLIDKGNVIESYINEAWFLPENFQKIQPQAVECGLNNAFESFSINDLKATIELKPIFISVISESNRRLIVDIFDEKGKQLYPEEIDHPRWIIPFGQLPVTTQKISVLITHFESPDEIYIQYSCNQNNFTALTNELNNYYNNNIDTAVFDGNEGDLVAGKTSSGTWCRGRLMAFTSEEAVDVFFIDTGRTENLLLKNIKKLNASFFSFNAFARKVSLDLEFSPDSLKKINSKLEALKGIEGLIGYFINEDGKILLEIIYNGVRITPTLIFPKSSLSRSVKFDKMLAFIESPQFETFSECSSNDLQKDGLKVFVIHIDNPNKFWIHKESSIGDFQQFQEKLQNACKTLPEHKNFENGDVVAAIFYRVWYRALIINSVESFITVKFIDYGNIVEIDLNNESIKQLPIDLKTLPSFASQFSLRGNWKESATAKFEEIILQYEDPVTAVILEEGDPVVVDLFKDGKSITKVLIEAGESNNDEDCDVVYVTHINSPYDFYIQRHSSTKTLEFITKKLSEVVETKMSLDNVKKDEIYLAKFSEDEMWYRAKVTAKFEHYIEVLFIDYGNVSNVSEVINLPEELNECEIPPLGENCSLLLGQKCDVWSEEACKIFGNYANGRPLKMKTILKRKENSVVALFFENQSISEKLAEVSEDDKRFESYISHWNSLNDFYLNRVNDDQFDLIKKYVQSLKEVEQLVDRTLGSLCLVGPFSDENVWYRAKILQLLADDYCEVLLLDSGKLLKTRELVKSEMNPIMEIPARAIKCSLAKANQNIAESIQAQFINLYKTRKTLRARIIDSAESNIVSLKLDGLILEETLELGNTDCQKTHVNLDNNKLLNEEVAALNAFEKVDNIKSENNPKTPKKEMCMNKKSEIGVVSDDSVQNETDEEKQVKIAYNAGDGGFEGFKSDDEKEITGILSSSHANITDNELIEEFQDIIEESSESNGELESFSNVNEIIECDEREDRARMKDNETSLQRQANEEEQTFINVENIENSINCSTQNLAFEQATGKKQDDTKNDSKKTFE